MAQNERARNTRLAWNGSDQARSKDYGGVLQSVAAAPFGGGGTFYFLSLYKGETYFVSCIFTHTSEYIYICWLKKVKVLICLSRYQISTTIRMYVRPPPEDRRKGWVRETGTQSSTQFYGFVLSLSHPVSLSNRAINNSAGDQMGDSRRHRIIGLSWLFVTLSLLYSDTPCS